jgi:uncharacterized protein YndB with AHSA1/START domain
MVAPVETTSAPQDRVLTLTRVFDAPRELVFRVWTKPEHLAQWWGPSDFTLPHCEQDFRVGGKYRFCMRAPDGTDHWVWGEYREIAPPERLAFTWHREDADGKPFNQSVVTVTFDEVDGGRKTKLTLHQAVFWTVDDRDAHRGGWSQCIERLGAYVEQQKGKDRNMSEAAVAPAASTDVPAWRVSKAAWWAGTIISTLVVLWMGVLGTVFLVLNRAMIQQEMAKQGYPPNSAIPILIAEVLSAILYAIPRTAVLGAILLTGYLGGAVATHVHAGESKWFFPVIVGVLVWLGLYLRDRRVRDLTPLRKV